MLKSGCDCTTDRVFRGDYVNMVTGEIYCNRTEALKDLATHMHWPRGERREQTGRNFFLPVTSFLLVHVFSKHIKVYTGLFHINTCLWKFLSNKQEILFKQPPPGFTASPERMRGNRGAVNRPSSLGRSRTWMSGLRPSGPRDELRGLSPPSGVPQPPSSLRHPPLHPLCGDAPPSASTQHPGWGAARPLPRGCPGPSPWPSSSWTPCSPLRAISSPSSLSPASDSPGCPCGPLLLRPLPIPASNSRGPSQPLPAGSPRPPPSPPSHAELLRPSVKPSGAQTPLCPVQLFGSPATLPTPP